MAETTVKVTTEKKVTTPKAGLQTAFTRHTCFYFMRHGQTNGNACSLIQGHTDVPLNEAGRFQAHYAGRQLSASAVRINQIIASPLLRAKETARIVAEYLACDLSFDEGLIEADFGEKENQSYGEWFQSWLAGEYRPKSGEDFFDLRTRAFSTLNRLLKPQKPATPSDPAILIVSHGAFFQAARREMTSKPDLQILANALPIHCIPTASEEKEWHFQALFEPPDLPHNKS